MLSSSNFTLKCILWTEKKVFYAIHNYLVPPSNVAKMYFGA